MRTRIFALVILLAEANVVQAQTQSAPADAAAAPAPITTSDTALPGALTVPVMINGRGPFDFVIDTGSTRTVISAELADRLQLPASGKVRIHAMGGTAEVRAVKIDSLQLSTNHEENIKVAALSRDNLGADGLIGLNLLKNLRIVMDFVENTIRIEPSAPIAAPVAEDPSDIVVIARARHGQLVMVDADANGQQVWVIVDTGSQNSVGNFRLMSLLQRDRTSTIRSIEMIDVIGRRTPAEYTFVNRLRIGGITMGNTAIAFADAHPFTLFGLNGRPSLLLGRETLQAFRRVTIDFPSRKVSFQIRNERLNRGPAGPAPPEY